MENLGFYMMYVVEGIFVLLLLYAGGFCYKFPLNYQTALDYVSPEGKYFTTSILRYPYYSSKRALVSKEDWAFAQKMFGKYLLLFAGMQAMMGMFWYPLAKFAIALTKWDEAGMVIIICPVVLFFILANVLTELQLRKR